MLEQLILSNFSYAAIPQEFVVNLRNDDAHSFSTVATCIIAALLALVILSLQRPALPINAPPLWKPEDWPILGALRYYKRVNTIIVEATNALLTNQKSTSGAFSLFLGKKLVVSVGDTAQTRTNFFENKDLSLIEGYVNRTDKYQSIGQKLC